MLQVNLFFKSICFNLGQYIFYPKSICFLLRYGKPNVAIFNSYYFYSILYSMFNYLFNIQPLFSVQRFSSTQLFIQYSIIQLFIQHLMIYSMFNFLFNISMFNVFSNIQLFIRCSTFYSTFNYPLSIQHFIQHSIIQSMFNFFFIFNFLELSFFLVSD